MSEQENRWPDDYARCPSCGFIGDMDDFDCIQACDGCVFCQQCGTEFDFDTGKVHEYGSCDECRHLVDVPLETER